GGSRNVIKAKASRRDLHADIFRAKDANGAAKSIFRDTGDPIGDDRLPDHEEPIKNTANFRGCEPVVVKHQKSIDLVIYLRRGAGNRTHDPRFSATQEKCRKSIVLSAQQKRVGKSGSVIKPVRLTYG